MNFGMYLVKEGRLSSDDFVALLDLQMTSRPQMGTLAIEAGDLSVRQVFQILRQQCQVADRRFGEVAMDLGFLTEQQVAMLVFQQSQQATPLADLMVIHGYADPDDVERWLDEFRGARGRSKHAYECSTSYEYAEAMC